MASNQLIKEDFFTPVADLLPLVEERMFSQNDSSNLELQLALQHLISSGGKRIRPAVTLLTGEMLKGDKDRLVTLAAAIEMLHTATLVHDDLIDGALLRRGIATLNAQWSPAATVLAGDFIFARAAELAAQTNSIEVMHKFAETLATIVNGEINQLFSSNELISRQDYEKRIFAKTASLFEVSTTAAAIISDVEKNVLKRVKDFGYAIGMAFQIVDDVLDFTSEQTTIGKPVASDLRQGLITLPVIYYLEWEPKDVEILSIINSDRCNEAIVERFVSSIRESGAIERAMDDARNYIRRGLNSIANFPDNSEKNALVGLSHYIVERRY